MSRRDAEAQTSAVVVDVGIDALYARSEPIRRRRLRAPAMFEIVGDITNVQVIATGRGIRRLKTLRKRHGGKRWRKLKGDATVRLANGSLRRAEIHWYEAHGVGKRGLKIKRFLD